MKPTIGRIVLYTMPPADCGSFGTPKGQSQTVPAIIVSVHSEELVNLRVMSDSSFPSFVETSVPLKGKDDSPETGYYWEWPSRD